MRLEEVDVAALECLPDVGGEVEDGQVLADEAADLDAGFTREQLAQRGVDTQELLPRVARRAAAFGL